MKNLIYVLFVFIIPITSSCQEEATTKSGKTVMLYKNGTYKVVSAEKSDYQGLKSTDIVKIENIAKCKKDTFKIINGDESLVDCKISIGCNYELYTSLGIDKLNSILSTANTKAMFQMKNRRTYVPKKIFAFYSENSKEWVVNIEYIAQNDYGATKDGNVYVNFTESGDFKNIISL